MNQGEEFGSKRGPRIERTFCALTKLPKFMFCTFMVKVNASSAGKVPPLTGKEIFEEGMEVEGMICPI